MSIGLTIYELHRKHIDYCAELKSPGFQSLEQINNTDNLTINNALS